MEFVGLYFNLSARGQAQGTASTPLFIRDLN